jgi:lipoprotein-anchoring transpeptidase ErfK/SrfK
MSSKYDSGTGINNMDYMLRITKDGIALHAGNVDEESKGCIHVNEIDAPSLYRWASNGFTVIVTRNSYMKFSK